MRSKITRVPSILLILQPFLSFLPHKINYSWEGDCGGEIFPEANELIRNRDFPPTLQCTSSFSDEIQVVPHPHWPKPINNIVDPYLYPLPLKTKQQKKPSGKATVLCTILPETNEGRPDFQVTPIAYWGCPHPLQEILFRSKSLKN